MRRIMRVWAAVAAVILTCQCAFAAQVLEAGSEGETVRVLTRRLCELGYMKEAVDTYGEGVTSAVGDFQTANGLERTGTADLETQQLIYSDSAVRRQDYIASYIKKYSGINLAVQSTGDMVVSMQKALKNLGYYPYDADGVFGDATKKAVENYQRANGISPTGIADASTLIRLLEGQSMGYEEYISSQCAEKGNSGSNVKLIQARLRELGYFYGDPTGNFGEITQRGVMRFQESNALTVTGKVDVETYSALFAATAIGAPNDGALHAGSEGDEVYNLQQRLFELGFLDIAPNGVYGRGTEAAVLLFCAANELSPASDAGVGTIAAIYADSALGISALDGTMDNMDAALIGDICSTAELLDGMDFPAEEGELFPGFNFIRYVFACHGVAVTDPGEIIARMGDRIYAPETTLPGDIVVFTSEDEDGMTRSFAICVSGGRLAYSDPETGVVMQAQAGEMEYDKAYVWQVAPGNQGG